MDRGLPARRPSSVSLFLASRIDTWVMGINVAASGHILNDRDRALALPLVSVYTALMSNTGAQIIEQVSRGHIAFADRSRASLLLLGLTRGCRVL